MNDSSASQSSPGSFQIGKIFFGCHGRNFLGYKDIQIALLPNFVKLGHLRKYVETKKIPMLYAKIKEKGKKD